MAPARRCLWAAGRSGREPPFPCGLGIVGTERWLLVLVFVAPVRPVVLVAALGAAGEVSWVVAGPCVCVLAALSLGG